MDIAKIRKKLKEKEAGIPHPGVEELPTKKTGEQDITREEKIPEQPPDHTPVPETDLHPDDEGYVSANVDVKQKIESTVIEKREAKEEKKPPVPQKKTDTRESEEIIEILTFSMLKEEFAFRISQLAEILRSQWITKVPNVPGYVLGITSLRGKIIPVIDLKFRISLTSVPSDYSRQGKILIINGSKGPIGASVDKVIGVVRVLKAEILPPPSHLSEKELKYIDGIAVVDKRFVSIINMEEAVTLDL
jgi:purine-binding chemotaxis protein CheW